MLSISVHCDRIWAVLQSLSLQNSSWFIFIFCSVCLIVGCVDKADTINSSSSDHFNLNSRGWEPDSWHRDSSEPFSCSRPLSPPISDRVTSWHDTTDNKYTTLHYITLHYITLHYNTLHYSINKLEILPWQACLQLSKCLNLTAGSLFLIIPEWVYKL